jgi:hypothetical protein
MCSSSNFNIWVGIFLYGIASVFLSCNLQNSSNTKVFNKGNNRESFVLKSSFVVFPENIEIYNPYNQKIISLTDTSYHFRLLYLANSTCPTCLNVINQIAQNSKRLKDRKIRPVVICWSDNLFETFKFYCERGDFKEMQFPFYFDKSNAMEKLNPHFDFGINAFLLDNKNRIVNSYNVNNIPFEKLCL